MSDKTNIWNELEIEKTNDKKAIKKAYLKKLKITNPEDNPEGFMRLHDAYEAAMSVCNYYEDDYDEETESEESYNQELYFEDILSTEEKEIKEKIDIWVSEFEEVYNDLQKRFDIKCWNKLLYENLPMCIYYYNKCRTELSRCLIYNISLHFIPESITKLINNFFSYSGGDIERTKQGKNWLRTIDRKMKLNENIRFDLFDTSVSGENLDAYCYHYVMMIDRFVRNIIANDKINYKISKKMLKQILKHEDNTREVFYLPFEAALLKSDFDNMTDEEIDSSIEELENTAWKRLSGNVLNRGREKELKDSISMEINLLKAEYMIHKNSIKEAERILEELYKKVNVKDFMFIIRLSAALSKAGRHYEEYRCLYILTYLKPGPEIFSALRKIRENIITQYEDAEKGSKPYTNIQMSRMYLQNDEVFKAYDIIRNIRGRKSFKYYAAAYMSAVDADYYKTECKIYEKLEEYDNTKLSTVELLEWEEIRAVRLYREGKYAEAIVRCNELLEEYPGAYNFNLLRIAVQTRYKGMLIRRRNRSVMNIDWFEAPFGMVEYENIEELITKNPMGARARIISASKLFEDDCTEQNKRALSILEPVKDKYPYHYKCMEIFMLYNLNFKRYAEECLGFLKDNVNKRLNIPLAAPGLISFFYMFHRFGNVFTKLKLNDDEINEYMNYIDKFILRQFNKNEYERYASFAYELLIFPKKLSGQNENFLHVANQLIECCEEEEKEHWRYTALCTALIYNKKFEEAEKIINEADDKYKGDLYNSMGNIYSKIGDLENDIKYHELAVKYAQIRLCNIYYFNLANTYVDMGKHEKAIELLEELKERFGCDAEYFMKCSYLYQDLEDLDKADECIEKSYEYAKEVSDYYILNKYHSRKGSIYYDKGDFEKAAAEYEKAEKQSDSKNFLSSYYLSLMATGKFEKASEICCENYIKNNRSFSEFNQLIIMKTFLNIKKINNENVNYQLSDYNLKYYLDERRKKISDNIYSVLYMALTYNLLDEDEKADKCLEYAKDKVDGNVKNDTLRRFKAIIMAKRGNLQEAIKLCEEIDNDRLKNNENINSYYSHIEMLAYKKILEEQKMKGRLE